MDLCVGSIGELNADPERADLTFELHKTIFLNDLLDREQLVPAGGDCRITNEHIVNHARLAHPQFARLRSELVDENVILRYARVIGVQVERVELQGGLDEFRRERSLLKKDDILAWLESNRLSLEQLAELIERQLLIRKTRELCSRVEHRATLDRLRIDGHYPAMESAAVESERTPGCGSLVSQDEPREQDLLEFYCAHQGRKIPHDIDSLAAELGFADRTTLVVELKKYRHLNSRPSQCNAAERSYRAGNPADSARMPDQVNAKCGRMSRPVDWPRSSRDHF